MASLHEVTLHRRKEVLMKTVRGAGELWKKTIREDKLLDVVAMKVAMLEKFLQLQTHPIEDWFLCSVEVNKVIQELGIAPKCTHHMPVSQIKPWINNLLPLACHHCHHIDCKLRNFLNVIYPLLDQSTTTITRLCNHNRRHIHRRSVETAHVLLGKFRRSQDLVDLGVVNVLPKFMVTITLRLVIQ